MATTEPTKTQPYPLEGEEDEEEITGLDEVKGEVGILPWLAIVIFLIASVALFGLAMRGGIRDNDNDGTRFMSLTDKYTLQPVAIRTRFFWQFGWHTLTEAGPIVHAPANEHDGNPHMQPYIPFKVPGCICEDPRFRNSDAWRRQWCQGQADSHIMQRNQAYQANLITDNTDDDDLDIAHMENDYAYCKYFVPFTPLWAAMSCACLGIATVAWYAIGVLEKPRGTKAMDELGTRIAQASLIFLKQEYMWLGPFVFALWVFLYCAVDGQSEGWRPDTSVSFLFGAIFSAACGFMGMRIATEGNVRTAAACASAKGYDGLSAGLQVAFRSGACMGLGVVSFGMLGLAGTYTMFGNTLAMGGFGFGGSAVALFARVGGGIYTKAADVGGDLCGKVEAALDEDNPKNPATIADCVGDNVGDIAGMGADLFESFVGSVVAASVLGAAEFGEQGVGLPFYVACIGLIASIIGTVYVYIPQADEKGGAGLEELLLALTLNVLLAGVIIVIAVIVLCLFMFKDEAEYLGSAGGAAVGHGGFDGIEASVSQRQPGARVMGAILQGLLCGVLIGKITEYFTSHTYNPTRSIARAGEYGPGPVVIQGIGMGMFSTVVPMTLICATILGSYHSAGLYGTAIACVGMLSTLGVTMSTDAYGPVADNAGGIAEMTNLPKWVRENTDELDALGNTTAATGKGFANGSAVLAAVSLLAAYTRTANLETIDLLRPVVVVGLLLGALLPYIFAAMTMLSVNRAAQEMMAEVRHQFDTIKDSQGRRILDPEYDPDGPMPNYDRCIAISTNSALREMLMPGLLAVFSPLVIGFTFGSSCLGGFLLGAIATGYLLGVQMSNSGGAWDNAKKWVEAGQLKLKGVTRPKKSLEHAAVVAGDTVGDPFKDTSGPSLNILIKLMTQFSFVIAPLLDEDWDHVWVGVLLFACAVILFLIVSKCVVSRPELPDDDYYDTTEEGVHEKLDFLDGLQRRIDADLEKISKGRDALIKVRSEVQEQHADAWGKWQHENK
eukprot:TRINITY_DN372_c0_g1_i4.p1 TRINITY_DN372_c0_g1~~TRINITY_DN372_c0_g1_i4.p1  ORF type:complete len:1008 (+),score=370.70 TRINITY_DN372_c0_g1_i4:106-3129(+)